MQPIVETVSNILQHCNFAAVFLDAALKSTVVLLLAAGICLCWRNASAATRHFIWFLAILSLPFLPLFSTVLPSWHRPLWSVSTSLVSGNQVALSFEFVPSAANSSNSGATHATAQEIQPSGTHQTQSTRTRQIAAQFSANWLLVALTAWFAGTIWWLASLLFGRIRVANISRRAKAVTDDGWQSLLRSACAEIGIRQTVRLLQSVDDIMPMTWGWRQPVVLLPANANAWTQERRRVVLAHELAHIKRGDWAAQMIAGIICGIYWFNPLAWLGTREMCVERERACDDLLLNGGWKASDYADHLLEIARSFRRAPRAVAVAMARPSGLEQRLLAMLDEHRNRKRVAGITAAILALAAVGLGFGLGGSTLAKGGAAATSPIEASGAAAELKSFVTQKRAQAEAAMKAQGTNMLPEYTAMFDAAAKGDWPTISRVWADLRDRAPQYENKGKTDERLHGTAWQTVCEIWLAFGNIAVGDGKSVVQLGHDAIHSIPAGSIYFGGTDPGRGVITALSKSHVNADPFFALTQNALADGTYLEYLRDMYGAKIYVPSSQDAAKCFNDYMADIQKRYAHDNDQSLNKEPRQMKPGENFTNSGDGRMTVSGQVAVMSVNALLTKLIFDKNPDREFFIEESFPLDWMYPHLSPNGPIMKINRQPLTEISEAVVQKDRDYWTHFLQPIVGDWLNLDTPLSKVADYAAKQTPPPLVGDKRDNQADNAQKWASKLRSSIAGVYVWRVNHAANDSDKARMAHEADYAFRQAWATCPYSPEVVFQYVAFLARQNRVPDAIVVANTAHNLDPKNDTFDSLAKQVQQMAPRK